MHWTRLTVLICIFWSDFWRCSLLFLVSVVKLQHAAAALRFSPLKVLEAGRFLRTASCDFCPSYPDTRVSADAVCQFVSRVYLVNINSAFAERRSARTPPRRRHSNELNPSTRIKLNTQHVAKYWFVYLSTLCKLWKIYIYKRTRDCKLPPRE